jgi:hypothetical protein
VKLWQTNVWICKRSFDQDCEVYSVVALGGGRFAAGGAKDMDILVYGSPDGLQDQPPPPRSEDGAKKWQLMSDAPAWPSGGEAGSEKTAHSARERRAKLLGKSQLDITMSDYRKHLVGDSPKGAPKFGGASSDLPAFGGADPAPALGTQGVTEWSSVVMAKR